MKFWTFILAAAIWLVVCSALYVATYWLVHGTLPAWVAPIGEWTA